MMAKMRERTRGASGVPALRLGVVAAIVGAVTLAACEGPNRFTGPVPGGPGGGEGTPPEVSIDEAPPSAPVGDSVEVQASASDPDGLASIRFLGRTLRGDPDLGTDESVVRFTQKTVEFDSPPTDTTITRFLQSVGSERETTWIVVEATDNEGNVGIDSVALELGGPSVALRNLASPQAGTDFPLQMEASDPELISSVRIEVSGVVDTTLIREISPPAEEVTMDTLLFIPAGVQGEIDVVARATNTRGQVGTTRTFTLDVVQEGALDEEAPSLRLEVDAPQRLELQNEVAVVVTGRDNAGGSGVVSAGITVLAISPSRGDTILRDSVVTFDRPRSATVSQTFSFQPFNVDPLRLPDTLIFQVTGFMRDAAGNCGAAVSEATALQSLPCEEVTVGGETGTLAQAQPGLNLQREVVAGKTVVLPAGGQIMDAAVDTLRRNLFLSNIRRNRVEVFRLDEEVFGTAIGVGSEPWGLAMVNDFTAPDPDSLVVANSNGTNLELVDLDLEVARPEERYFFPDVVLFNFIIQEGDAGLTFEVETLPDLGNLSFSDRPQYIAVDTFGNRIFSTMSLDETNEVGTVRKAFFEEGWQQPETKIFVEHAAFQEAEDAFAFAHIDDIRTSVAIDTLVDGEDTTFDARAVVTLVDHVPGFPNQIITGSADLFAGQLVQDAWAELVSKGSDVFMHVGGTWSIASLGFNDTTFVSASGDGTLVAIGEGAVEPLGRVLLYQAARGADVNLTGSVPVADLLTNRPEPVQGIGLNYDGTLGVVRGSSEVAFFDSRLRKQGGTSEVVEGGAGAALHPLHADQKTLFNLGGGHNPDVHMAFVGGGDGTIDIVDTFRFLRIGQLTIRDVVSGPLRAVLPFPGDNAGLQCSEVPVFDKRGASIGQTVRLYEGGDFNRPASPAQVDENCIVVKLFAVTDSEGVVVVDVRKADVLRLHPARR